MITKNFPPMTMTDDQGVPVPGVPQFADDAEAICAASGLSDGTYFLERPTATIVVDLACDVVEPPEPEPVTGPLEQYVLNTDTGSLGATSEWYSEELEQKWDSTLARDSTWKFGDWTNSLGEPNSGGNPYATLIIPGAFTPGYISVDVTALVSKWVETGHNRGAYFRAEGNKSYSQYAVFGGRLGNAPLLEIITDEGSFELSGMLGGWSTSSVYGVDTSQSAMSRKGNIVLAHWRGLTDTVSGVVRSATMKLWVIDHYSGSDTLVDIHETNPPYLYVADHGEPPILGLAAEVGENNLRGAEGCIQAGDFRLDNWAKKIDNNDQGYYGNALDNFPCGLLNTIPTRGNAEIDEWQTAEFLEQEDGSVEFRGNFIHGDGKNYYVGGFDGRASLSEVDLTDDRWPAMEGTGWDELYARTYIMLEDDFYTNTNGVKGGLGFDYRMGYWKDVNGGYWQAVSGNSGAGMTGKKRLVKEGQRFGDGNPAIATKDQFEYQGGCARQHQGNYFPTPTGRPHEKFRPVMTMVSHLGPYETNEPYAGKCEEVLYCGRTVVEKGKHNSFEWRLKLNSIVGPFDELGNGTPVRDGELELWVNGRPRWIKNDFAFRCHPELKIEGAWVVWLHGGTIPPAPGDSPHYRMNHYVMATEYIGPMA